MPNLLLGGSPGGGGPSNRVVPKTAPGIALSQMAPSQPPPSHMAPATPPPPSAQWHTTAAQERAIALTQSMCTPGRFGAAAAQAVAAQEREIALTQSVRSPGRIGAQYGAPSPPACAQPEHALDGAFDDEWDLVTPHHHGAPIPSAQYDAEGAHGGEAASVERTQTTSIVLMHGYAGQAAQAAYAPDAAEAYAQDEGYEQDVHAHNDGNFAQEDEEEEDVTGPRLTSWADGMWGEDEEGEDEEDEEGDSEGGEGGEGEDEEEVYAPLAAPLAVHPSAQGGAAADEGEHDWRKTQHADNPEASAV